MVERSAFEILLSIVKLESETKGDGSYELILKNIERLRNCLYLSCSDEDVLSISSYLLSFIRRGLNNSHSHESYEITDAKMLKNVLEVLHCHLSMTEAKSMVIQIEYLKRNISKLIEILISITSLSECLKLLYANNATLLSLDELSETIGYLTFSVLLILLKIFYSLKNNAKIQVDEKEMFSKLILEKVQGPVLFQLVHTLLLFSDFRSKQMSVLSLNTLYLMLDLFEPLVDNWREVIPGLYSKLFTIAKSDFKRGSTSILLSLISMIKIVHSITKEDILENRLLSQYQYDSNEGLEGSSIKKILLHAELANISLHIAKQPIKNSQKNPLEQDLEEISSSRFSKFKKLNQRFNDLPAFERWRVLLIQKVEPTLSFAYIESLGKLSPKQKILLASHLQKLILDSVEFLGPKCIFSMLSLLMCTFADENNLVKKITRRILEQTSDSLSTHTNLSFDLKAYFKDSLMNCSKNIVNSLHKYDEDALGKYLNQLAATIFFSKDDVAAFIKILNQDFLARIQVLLQPDLSALKTMILETRSYSGQKFSSPNPIQGGYYRIPYKFISQESILCNIRSILPLFGKFGGLGQILNLFKKSWRKVRHNIKSIRSLGSELSPIQDDNVDENSSDEENSQHELRDLSSSRNTLEIFIASLSFLKLAMIGILRTKISHKDHHNTMDENPNTSLITEKNEILEKNIDRVAEEKLLESNVDSLILEARSSVKLFKPNLIRISHSLHSIPAYNDPTSAIPSSTSPSITTSFTRKDFHISNKIPAAYICVVCKKSENVFRCSQCKSVGYCSRDHQKVDWPIHKKSCHLSIEADSFLDSQGMDDSELDDVFQEENDPFLYDANYILSSMKFFQPLWPDVACPVIQSATLKSFLGNHVVNNDAIDLSLQEPFHPFYTKDKLYRNIRQAFEFQLSILEYCMDYNTMENRFKGMGCKSIFIEIGKYLNFAISCILDNMATCFLLLPPEDIPQSTTKTMFLLYELSVSKDTCIKQAAETTIRRISIYLGYEDEVQFLRRNLDILITEITQNLRHISSSMDIEAPWPERTSRSLIPSPLIHQRITNNYTKSSHLYLIIDLIMKSLKEYIDFDEDFRVIPQCRQNQTQQQSTFKESTDSMPLVFLKDLTVELLDNMDALIAKSTFPLKQETEQANSWLLSLLNILYILSYHSRKPTELFQRISNQYSPLKLLTKELPAYFIRAILGEIFMIHFSEGDQQMIELSKTPLKKSVFDSLFTHYQAIEAINDPEKWSHNPQRINDDTLLGKAHKDDESFKVSSSDDDHDESNNTLPSISILLDILKRCQYFITVESPYVQTTVIYIIATSLVRMVDSEKDLYPAIHRLWPYLISLLDKLALSFQEELITYVSANTRKSTQHWPIEAADSSGTWNIGSASAIGNRGKQLKLSAELLHLFTIITVVAPKFIPLKLKESLLPHIIYLMKYFFIEKVFQYKHTHQTFSAVSLVLKATDTQTTPSDSFHRNQIFSTLKASSASYTKLKQGILCFLEALLNNKELIKLLTASSKVIIWFILPFLLSDEHEDLRKTAVELILKIKQFSPAFSNLIYSAFSCSTYNRSPSRSQGNADLLSEGSSASNVPLPDYWMALVHDPSLVAAYHQCQEPQIDGKSVGKHSQKFKNHQIWEEKATYALFQSDATFIDSINRFLSPPSLDIWTSGLEFKPNIFDDTWVYELDQWSTI